MYGNEYNQLPQQMSSLGKLSEIPEPMKSIPTPIPQGQLAYPAYQSFGPEVSKNFSQTSYIHIPPQRTESPSPANGFMPMSTMHVSFPQLQAQKSVIQSMAYPIDTEYIQSNMAMYQSNPKTSQEFYGMTDGTRGNPQIPVMFVPQYQTLQSQMQNSQIPINYYNQNQIAYSAPADIRKEKTLNKNELNKFLKDDFDELEEFYQKYEKDMPVKPKNLEPPITPKVPEKITKGFKENFGDLSEIHAPVVKKIVPPPPSIEPEFPQNVTENLLPSTSQSQEIPNENPEDNFELPNDSVYLPIGEVDDDSVFIKNSFLLNDQSPGILRTESRQSLIGHSVLINIDNPAEMEILERNRRDEGNSWGAQGNENVDYDSGFRGNFTNSKHKSDPFDEASDVKNNFSKKNYQRDLSNEIVFDNDEMLGHDISGIQKIEEKRVYSNRYKSTNKEKNVQEVDHNERADQDEGAMSSRSRPIRHHNRNRREEKPAEENDNEKSQSNQNDQDLPTTRSKNRKAEKVEVKQDDNEEIEDAAPKYNSRYNNTKKPQPIIAAVDEDDRPVVGAAKTFQQILEEELAKEKSNQNPVNEPPIKTRKTAPRTNPSESRGNNAKADNLTDDGIALNPKKVNNFIDDDRPLGVKSSKKPVIEDNDEDERPKTHRKKIEDEPENGSKTERAPITNSKGSFLKSNNAPENQIIEPSFDDRPLPNHSAKKNANKPAPIDSSGMDDQDSLVKPSNESTRKPVARKPKAKLTRKQLDALDWLKKFHTEEDFVPNFLEQCQEMAGFWGFIDKVKEASTSSANHSKLQDSITEYQKKHETLSKENQELTKKLDAIKKEKDELMEKMKTMGKNTSNDHNDNDRSLNETGLLDKEGKPAKTLEAKSSRREQQENEALRNRIRRLEENGTLKENLYKETLEEKNKQIADLNAKLKEALNIKDDGRSPSSKNVRKPVSTTTTTSQRNVSPIKSSTNRNVSPLKAPAKTTTTPSTNPAKKSEAESVDSEIKEKTSNEKISSEKVAEPQASIKESAHQTHAEEKVKPSEEQQEKTAGITLEGLKLNESKRKYFSKRKERVSNAKLTTEIKDISDSVIVQPSDSHDNQTKKSEIITEINSEKNTDSFLIVSDAETDSKSKTNVNDGNIGHSDLIKSDSRQSQSKLSTLNDKPTSLLPSNRQSRSRLADLSTIVRDTLLTEKIKEQDEEDQEEEPSSKTLPDPKRLTKAFDSQQALAIEILNSFENLLPVAKIFTEKIDKNSYHYENNKYFKEYLSHMDGSRQIVKTKSLPDGKIQNIFDSQVQEIIFTNGSRRIIFPDGYTLVFFGNGDIKQSLPDTTIIYYYSEHDTTQTTLPDNVADVS